MADGKHEGKGNKGGVCYAFGAIGAVKKAVFIFGFLIPQWNWFVRLSISLSKGIN